SPDSILYFPHRASCISKPMPWGHGAGDRGYSGSRSEYGGRGGSRDYYGRSRGGYRERSGGSYRDNYDSYATHE
uniref:Uncharacterized protein n=1 Tax=Leptobrachium leishanense TaxID=445787 RepID=A0A8C5PU08_9ANUR